MIFLKLILCINILYCSYSSMYGFGDNLDRGDSFSDFLHQPSMHFNGYKNSSFNMYNSDVVFSMNYDFRNSDSGLIDSYISDLHFTVPIDKGFFSLGFSPKTFADIEFLEEYNFQSPYAYRSSYISNGGISSGYINFTRNFFNLFIMSFKYSNLFGNLERNKVIRIYDLDFSDIVNDEYNVSYNLSDSMTVNRVHRFKGNNIEVESKFTINENDLILSFVYGLPLEIETRLFLDPYIDSDNEDFGTHDNLEELEYYTEPNQIIVDKYSSNWRFFSIGYKKRLSLNRDFIVKLSHKPSFKYNSNLMYLPDPDIFSLNFLYSSFISNLDYNSLSYINYKIGLFHKNLNFSKGTDHDYGVLFNFGIKFKDKNGFTVLFKLGQKSHNLLNVKNEKYLSIGIGLENVEKWFLKGA